ncbi:MarR family winged helix-turn-helix transcriptional regulator [Consotaella salsifontis]|uniref:Transcriptional regulator, MarR family n=1 Tax=Consotaella salsifontis TaxID=1365950 RepID=A0A1T4QUN6_9HYPH|nr:MarR family transcriptional regulator [Consotaella salsifontis]SKA07415.1 transcriptional regulator, MarR family [Consotaella salsifontis]
MTLIELKSGMQGDTGGIDPASAAGAPLTRSLLSIAKSTRALFALLLTDAGLHPGQDQLLCELDRNEPISVSKLADRLAVRPSTVSKMLDRLIEKDMVAREASDSDGRRTMVVLTSRGEVAKHTVLAIWSRVETELREALDGEDRDALVGAIDQFDGILTKKLRRLR